MANKTASKALIKRARELYQTEDVEIDDFNVKVSRVDESNGTWVAAWVWVHDDELNGEAEALADAREGMEDCGCPTVRECANRGCSDCFMRGGEIDDHELAHNAPWHPEAHEEEDDES